SSVRPSATAGAWLAGSPSPAPVQPAITAAGGPRASIGAGGRPAPAPPPPPARPPRSGVGARHPVPPSQDRADPPAARRGPAAAGRGANRVERLDQPPGPTGGWTDRVPPARR